MLDTTTKHRIDNARDTLVGKVPDPKSQIEQITIALIYKFMDDQDAEAENLGGKRKFFVGDFACYSWDKLMHSGLSGQAMLDLYMEALEKMPTNDVLPQLFRNILKNAYLPYRDPETLRGFLKIIDEFKYDNSERLGDAFEYLLSILGSQGDAGQFRTPRHIIDFIVALVDPHKDDAILDPACGTAGFLIAAHKYVLGMKHDRLPITHHELAITSEAVQSSLYNSQLVMNLSFEEKQHLAANVHGYDISPDMVRLSLVNLYLHGFVDPHIFEYDTLSSEERWNEYADVILANPPFMSPKGGIKPHKRFSVQSKRSEVLFVDYIAEHLTSKGRAGIIVPEGIIFQSQNAYKELRKMLVEKFLLAVISLPAGVFQPYSGVKTSILLLDRQLAALSDSIAFFKVENDGFSLGAQRRAIDKNDLPAALIAINNYKLSIRNEEVGIRHENNPQWLIVPKVKIAVNGEYNLSGEKYKDSELRSSNFPIFALSEIAEVIVGQSPPGESYNENSIGMPFYQGKTEFGKIFIGEPKKWTTHPKRFADKSDILMSIRAPVGPVNLTANRICIGRGLAAIRPITNLLLTYYAFYVIRSLESEITGDIGAAFASINSDEIKKIQIPLPPLEIQQAIVTEIESYQKIIDGARMVVDNYRPRIDIKPEWEVVELWEIISLEYGKPLKAEHRIKGQYPVFGSNGIVGYHNEYLIEGPAVIIGRKGTAGAVNYSDNSCYPIDTTFYVHIKDTSKLNLKFCYFQLQTLNLDKINVQSGVPGLNRNDAYLKTMPIPPLPTQQAIVTEIEAEQTIINANKELITRMENKITAVLARVWGE